MSIRQTRRGCFQEIVLGCEASDEFKWFHTTDGRNDQFGTTIEDSNCCLRIFCNGCHKFDMALKEEGSGDELMNIHRPMKCNTGPCKCCCYQTMEFSSNGAPLGDITEQFWCCVPRMMINDGNGNPVYKVHNPTCCGGESIPKDILFPSLMYNSNFEISIPPCGHVFFFSSCTHPDLFHCSD